MQQPHSRVRVAAVTPEQMDAVERAPYPYEPSSEFKIATLFSEPACLVLQEEWYKGHDTEWVFFNHTLMYVLAGTAEMRFWNGPNWDDRGAVEVGPGMVFLCPEGARVFWRVTSDEPFRRLVVDFPNPGFDFTDAGSLV